MSKLEDSVYNVNFNELIKKIHLDNKEKGFWPEDNSQRNVGEMLMLIVSELGEAIEAHRKGRFTNWVEYLSQLAQWTLCIDDEHTQFKNTFESCMKDTFEDEIADAVIRLFDLCGGLNIDLYQHIIIKLEYNKTREKLHGKQY